MKGKLSLIPIGSQLQVFCMSSRLETALCVFKCVYTFVYLIVQHVRVYNSI